MCIIRSMTSSNPARERSTAVAEHLRLKAKTMTGWISRCLISLSSLMTSAPRSPPPPPFPSASPSPRPPLPRPPPRPPLPPLPPRPPVQTCGWSRGRAHTPPREPSISCTIWRAHGMCENPSLAGHALLKCSQQTCSQEAHLSWSPQRPPVPRRQCRRGQRSPAAAQSWQP